MKTPFASDFLVPHTGRFNLSDMPTAIEHSEKKKVLKERLNSCIDEFSDLQLQLHAQDKYAVLLIFQAMDAAGKDSTIRAVMSGIDPTGCQVHAFKKPSTLELDHDFLWRSAVRLPERGRIGIFNRSYYEEVLVVKVHPEILTYQRLPDIPDDIWAQRYESIRDHEKHLARNGTVILKFFLNVSREEQHRRFLSRIETPRKNWKFSFADLEESALWPQYMDAYNSALRETSSLHAPWYAIPADDKSFMRLQVAEIVLGTLRQLPLKYPELDEKDRARLPQAREQLII